MIPHPTLISPLISSVDTTPPVISNCPEDQTITIELGQTSSVVFWSPPTATDNSGVVNIDSQTHSPGDSFPIGMTTVMYIFIDPEMLTSTCSFVVIVTTGEELIQCYHIPSRLRERSEPRAYNLLLVTPVISKDAVSVEMIVIVSASSSTTNAIQKKIWSQERLTCVQSKSLENHVVGEI